MHDEKVSTRDLAASIALDASARVARCSGNWSVSGLGRIDVDLERMRWPPGDVRVDISEITTLDMAGAWLLHRTRHRLSGPGRNCTLSGADARRTQLLELVARHGDPDGEVPRPVEHWFLEHIGRRSLEQFTNYLEFLSFLGQITYLALRILRTPATMYWGKVVDEVEEAGFDALPIVGLLAMLIGVVIAYQGGILLRQYGGSIFIADLVGLAILRELAPLITAIVVAGRTGSAYTARIGTMQVTEEISALRSMGIGPIDLLVLPKLFALVIALPLLTVFADLLGLIGGMLMAYWQLDVSFLTFVDRLREAVTLQSFLVGIGKAPIFAGIIACVGCFQGFKVSGGADAVGQRTTICVVQAIFMVILVDALFSIIFSYLGI